MTKASKHFLSSSERTGGTNDHPVWILDNVVPNITKIKCLEIEIPRSFWSVDGASDTFVFQEEIGASFSFSVYNGNFILGYDTTTGLSTGDIGGFMREVETKANAASTNGRTYTLKYNPATGLMDISINAGTFSVLGADPLSTAHKLLGFRAENTPQAALQVSPNVQRLTTYPENLYLRCNLGNNSYPSSIDNASTATNILTRIPATEVGVQGIGEGTYIKYKTNDTFIDVINTSQTIYQIDAYITHPMLNSNIHQEMGFMGVPWTFVLAYYDEEQK